MGEEEIIASSGSSFEGLSLVSNVVDGACNSYHCLLVDKEGHCFGLGSNSEQRIDPLDVAEDANIYATPRLLRFPAIGTQKVVQVSCGLNHSVCLLFNGRAVSFGQNEYGQLGCSRRDARAKAAKGPVVMQGVAREFVSQVACTYYSTLLLTRTGKVFSCGRGHYGVNGNGELKDQFIPKLVGGALAGTPSTFVAGGSRHCLVVSMSGKVYAFGDNHHGQLGVPPSDIHKGITALPIRVPLPGGVAIASAAAGEFHSVMLDFEGTVFVCGNNEYSQLGIKDNQDRVVPVTSLDSIDTVVQVACGRKHSAMLFHTGEVLTCGEQENELQGIDYCTVIAGGNTSIAFTSKDPAQRVPKTTSKRLYKMSLNHLSKISHRDKLVNAFRKLFTDVYVLNSAFVEEDYVVTPFPVKRFTRTMANKLELIKASVNVRAAIAPLIGQLDGIANQATEEGQLRAFYMLLFCGGTFFRELPAEHELLISAIFHLPKRSRKILYTWIKYDIINNPAQFLSHLLNPILRIMNERYASRTIWSTQFITLCRFIRDLYRYNEEIDNGRTMHFSNFYLAGTQDIEDVDLRRLYVKWRDALRQKNQKVVKSPACAICENPFLLPAPVKRRIMQIEEMESKTQHSLVNMWLANPTFFIMEVRRTSLLRDTINAILKAQRADLKKPLRVKFVGEEGLDAGGVKKEFFQLISLQLFSPDYSMFRLVGDTNQIWFNPYKPHFLPTSLEEKPVGAAFDEVEYMLVGALMGLAIYNSTLLDVQFPILLYQMLLDQFPSRPGMREIKKYDPALARSLQSILDIQSDAELESLALSFDITYEAFNEMYTIELIKNGSEIPVTLANRDDYILRVIRYYLVDSVKYMKEAMLKGFHLCIPPTLEVLSLFRAEELELIVVGTPDLDWVALQNRCEYEGGYVPKSKPVVWFWEMVHTFDYEQQQMLLKFCTGCPRAPVGGLAELPFKLQRAGPDTMRLPTASTCFNTVLLPDYSSKEKLQRLFLLAIENCEGFFLE